MDSLSIYALVAFIQHCDSSDVIISRTYSFPWLCDTLQYGDATGCSFCHQRTPGLFRVLHCSIGGHVYWMSSYQEKGWVRGDLNNQAGRIRTRGMAQWQLQLLLNTLGLWFYPNTGGCPAKSLDSRTKSQRPAWGTHAVSSRPSLYNKKLKTVRCVVQWQSIGLASSGLGFTPKVEEDGKWPI